MEEEIWKDVEGYEGLYQVSNFGRIKSADRVLIDSRGRKYSLKEKILKQYKCQGYLYVDLHKDGVRKRVSVHRLVALAFIPNPYHNPQVGHKDETRDNNCVDNLEWVTVKENSNMPMHKLKLSEKARSRIISEDTRKKLGEAHSGGKSSTAKKVICDNKVFECINDCANYYGLHQKTISRWLRGIHRTPEKFIEKGLAYYKEEL